MTESSWPGEQLVVAAQRGDIEAITALVSGAHPNVVRFARTLCATPEDAEDAAQEALIILYRRIGMLRASGALASWMFRIVRNECLRRARTMLRHPTRPRQHPPRVDAAVRSAEEEALQRLEAGRGGGGGAPRPAPPPGGGLMGVLPGDRGRAVAG
ncbi:RNA polymerase sigma factor, partial [Streptomyces smyrnaeus]|uniref:RNA polymerase sigma factor n=1 Tax=Streptomyces smyrnaeus TaxID=1387713 RepID=UPI0036B5F08E